LPKKLTVYSSNYMAIIIMLRIRILEFFN